MLLLGNYGTDNAAAAADDDDDDNDDGPGVHLGKTPSRPTAT